MRPLLLQKIFKHYNGNGDPHNHVPAYKQAVHLEQVQDTHTQIDDFGLTLESKALTWFQTLGPKSKVSLERQEKDFIATFSKIGIKRNTIAQIFLFQQCEHKMVRDCVNRLKQYIVCFLDDEKPNQARLLPIFLRTPKKLHVVRTLICLPT